MMPFRGFRGVILLWGLTGLISLVLNAITPSPVSRGAQTAVLLIAVFATFAWLLWFLGVRTWRDMILILAPALGIFLLGWLLLPSLLLPFLGAGLGWLVVVAFLLRKQVPAAQRDAIRHWRRGDFSAAIRALDELIRQSDDDAQRLLRAQILLAWGKPGRAARDIREVCLRQTENAAAFNLLAEARIQTGDWHGASEAGERARALAPQDWVAAYNLGMIADRQGDADRTIEMLKRAQELRISARRHRVMTWLWLARAHCRRGEEIAARECLNHLRDDKAAIREWVRLLSEETALPLRALVADDVALAEELVRRDEGSDADLEALGCGV